MAYDIKLTAAMNTNLLALQNTQKLMDMTQQKLATGLKVNSALDNPSAYYSAQSLNRRATDLDQLLDTMGQGIQTLKTVDEAITSATKFVEQAKAIAEQATEKLAAGDTDIALLEEQFSKVLDKMNDLIKNAGYKGINLLNATSGSPSKLVVYFAEGDRSLAAKLEINGVNGSAAGIGFTDASFKNWGTAAGPITDDASVGIVAPDAAAAGDIAVDSSTGTVFESDGADGWTDSGKSLSEYMETKGWQTGNMVDWHSGADAAANLAKAEASVNEAIRAISNLQAYASSFSTDYNIISNREDFTSSLVNVLTEGADKLTLADMNEEAANMLALQTRQQLGVNSLSLASQAQQAVLKLFG